MYTDDHKPKKAKIDHRLYLLQEFKAKTSGILNAKDW